MPHETVGELAPIALAIVKTLIFITGGIITYFAFKAYRRTRSPPLGYLAAGFAMITIGAALGGVLYEVIDQPLAIGIIVEGLFFLAGFVLIAYSLVGE